MKKKKKTRYARRKKQTVSSRLLPRFFLIVLFSFAIVGLLSQRPIPTNIRGGAPALPKMLTLRFTPTPTPKEKQNSIVPKASAQEIATNNFCVTLPVLFYHHVQPMDEAVNLGHPQFTVDSTTFDSQMLYLKENGYTTTSVDAVVDAVMNKRAISAKTVALTFDDGFVDMYVYAYPILKKYGFVGNFAIPTGLLGNGDYMTWEQVTELARDPSVFFYNHTWSHAAFYNASVQQMDFEIGTAQEDILKRLGRRSNIFFYPYGNFTNAIISRLRAYGYIAAFSTQQGTLHCQSDLMYLPRLRIGSAPLPSYGL